MKSASFRTCLVISLALGALLTQSASLLAAEADPAVQATFDRLIRAVQANDREAFIEGATDEMKQGVTPQVMERINRDLAPHLQKGFQPTYLCSLKQQGVLVQLWKVTFKDGSDDAVIRVAMRGDSLAGFFRQ